MRWAGTFAGKDKATSSGASTWLGDPQTFLDIGFAHPFTWAADQILD